MASIKRSEADLQQSVVDALAVQTAEILHHLDRWFDQTARRLASIEEKLDALASKSGNLDDAPRVVDATGEQLN